MDPPRTQRESGRELQDTRFQGFRASGLQGFRVSGLQDFRISGFQGLRVSGFQVPLGVQGWTLRVEGSRKGCGICRASLVATKIWDHPYITFRVQG